MGLEDVDKMRVYDKDKKLVKIVCNNCGHTVDVAGGLPKEEFLKVDKQWGYFSGKDGQIHQFDLCEQCYDRLLAGFLFPVNAEEAKELL